MNTLPADVPRFDPLEAFARWFARAPFALPPTPFDAVTRVNKFTLLTLYRHGPFQVQLGICEPGSEITEHTHPDCDTILIYLSGEMYFRKNGLVVIAPEDQRLQDSNGICALNGFTIRIGPNDWHGATVGPKGGSFLTVQHWLNGKPESVEKNWEGAPLDEAHAKVITNDPTAQT